MSVAGALTTATSLVQHDDVPWVWMGFEGSGVEMKLLRCGREDDVCTFINRFQPGFMAPKHLHLGEVHAYTLQGRWHYLEYDWEARAGDYVYEPPDTIHTLHVPEDNTEPTVVFFTVAKGMDLYDEHGEVFMKQDAKGLEELYRGGLAEQGLAWPEAILP
jgi:anti-sigma factor ChrR (cupin superfamily)